jgi:hypothetical protein
MPIRNHLQILLAGLLSLCPLSPAGAQARQSLSCQLVSFKVTLHKQENFERELGGGLLFRLTSEKDSGWFVDVVPAEANTKDYIYPVNLPLRFNANQTLGPGYDETAKSSLSHPHEMDFLLDKSDYDHIFDLVSNVLWSYRTPDPDKALADYTNAVDNARKGSIKIIISSYKTDPNTGALTRIKLRVGITTAPDFQFAPRLVPWPAPCHR